MTSRQKFGYHKYVFSFYSWFLETLSNFSFISGKKSIILFKSSRRLVWAFSGGGGGTSYVLVVSFMDVNFGFSRLSKKCQCFPPSRFLEIAQKWNLLRFFDRLHWPGVWNRLGCTGVGLFINWASPAGFDKYCLTPCFQWFCFPISQLNVGRKAEKRFTKLQTKKSFDGCETFFAAVRESSKKTSVTRTVVWQALLFR